MLEDAAVPLLLDVLQIIPSEAIRRILLAHVTEAAGEFRQPLTVGAFAEPADLDVIGLQEDRAGKKSYNRFCIVQVGSLE